MPAAGVTASFYLPLDIGCTADHRTTPSPSMAAEASVGSTRFGVSTDPFFAHIRLTQAEASHCLPCGRLSDEDMSTKIGRCTPRGIEDRFGNGLSQSQVGLGLLKVPIAGSPTLAVAALGILLGAIAGTIGQCTLLALPVILVIMLLSGGATPMGSMPIALQHVMLPFPAMSLVVAIFLTWAVAVLMGGLGRLAPAIFWVLIRWVWIYNIAWMFVLGGV